MKKLFFLSLLSATTLFGQVETFDPSADVSLGYHDNYSTADNNYASASQFAAFVIPGTQGGVNSNRGLIRFDLSSITPGTVVDSAKLMLFMYNGYSGTSLVNGHYGNNECYLRRVTTNWIESTVTWNTQPAETTVNQVIIPASDSSDQNYEVRVDDLVQFFIDNPSSNYGMKMGLMDEVDGNNLSFHSLNSSNVAKRPKLIVYLRTSGTIEISSFEVNCFPNPTSETISFDLGTGTKTVKIFDINGRMVNEFTDISEEVLSFNVAELQNGTYFYTVSRDNGIASGKFIKN